MIAINEYVHNGVRDFIYDNIRSYLSLLMNEYQDSIELPRYKKIVRGDADFTSYKSYPILMMRYGSTEIEQATLGSSGNDRYKEAITFWSVCTGSNFEKLQKRVERYTWALKAMFDENYTLGGAVDQILTKSFAYSPVFADKDIQIGFIDCILEFAVGRTYE